MDPKMAPQLVQQVIKIQSVFGSLFSGCGPPQVHLGSRLGPSEAVMDGLGPQKV